MAKKLEIINYKKYLEWCMKHTYLTTDDDAVLRDALAGRIEPDGIAIVDDDEGEVE